MSLVAVVLGNRMNDDGTISDRTLERLEFAKTFYNSQKPDFVILSGGVANPKARISEAEAMFAALGGAIDKEKIILENKSRTTAENAAFSAPIIASLASDEVVVISSERHIKRIYLNPLRLFKRALGKLGVKCGVKGFFG